MSELPKYDGTSDPHEHITTYTVAVKGNYLAPHEIETVLLKKFGKTLMKGPFTWYSLLPEISIDSFGMLADSFIKAHAGPERYRLGRPTYSGLHKTAGVYRQYRTNERLKSSPKDKETSDSRDSSYPRLSEYNFNIGVVEWVSGMMNIKGARFPKPMRSDPSRSDPNFWCEYHGTNGHQTGDCRHLREEVSTLLKNGHLKKFLSERAKNNYNRYHDNAEHLKAGEDPRRLTINMIFGGNEINGVTFSETKKMKVVVAHNKRLWEVAEDDITFSEEDADGLMLLHNNALGISLNILDVKIKHILVDARSSTNIIQLRVLEQAKLTENIISATKLLAGFNLVSVTTLGEILLPTNAEGVIKTTLFKVVDGDMGYYIILGRPWLHEMKAVLSTYHQLLKFPTLEGIKQISGDQPASREMNAISVSSSKGKERAA
ncbi:PREDICTED: uncharacterized protein LOC109239385 [Nicotiana attenuata]|uniref:uncharacterized protein LOC109239385 n=1 Tax=Nicotiana attenuata TaxID=49451 RepID=UPI000905BA32|nr:PREDICTED: uncharacterized protein LOC109239385 [Nicotiana attenuata]